MKAAVLSSAIFAALVLTSDASVMLFNLGSGGLDPQWTSGSYSQTATTLSWTNSVSLGDTVAGPILTGPIDLSPFTGPGWQFGIDMAIIAANPSVTFSAEFFDDSLNIALYDGATDSIAGGYAILSLNNAPPAFNFSSIHGFAFTWTGAWTSPGTTVTASDVIAIPEPGSALLLGLGAAGLYLLRRKAAR